MKCDSINELLTNYLLGDLPPAVEAEVKKHIEECPACQAQAGNMEKTLTLLKSALNTPSSAPAGLSDESKATILGTLHTAKPDKRNRPSRKKGQHSKITQWMIYYHPQLATAAALLILFSVFACILKSSLPVFKMGEVVGPPPEVEVRIIEPETPPELAEIKKMTDGADHELTKESGETTQEDTANNKDQAAKLARELALNKKRNNDLESKYKDLEKKFVSTRRGSSVDRSSSGSQSAFASGVIGPLDLESQKPEAPQELEEIEDIFGEPPAPPEPVKMQEANGEVTCESPAPPSDFSPQPAEFDSVAIVKSPVIMKGIFGSRSPSSRGRREAGWDKKNKESEEERAKEEPLVEIEFGGFGDEPSPSDMFTMSETPDLQQPTTKKYMGGAGGLAGKPEEDSKEVKKEYGKDSFQDMGIKKQTSNTGIIRDEKGLSETGAPSMQKLSEPKSKTARRKSEVQDGDKAKSSPTYKAVGVNPFMSAAIEPFSTFAIDVDTASYTMTRNYMLRGLLPPAEKVRTEEFVNFFDYGYKPPEKRTFKIYTQCAPSRFGAGMHMMKIGVKGKRIGREEQQPAALTFVVDTSGSMNRPDRIGLIKKSIKMLITELGQEDRVTIIQFSDRAKQVIVNKSAKEKEAILKAVENMQTSGSTNLELAMKLAYETAANSFKGGFANRVLLMSDGVANLGTDAADDILTKVEQYKDQGIQCSVFGFGMGTYNDRMLETLANKGDGAYVFIDSEEEARRVFVNDLAATLNTIASDVKIQVEFNPEHVERYRQLGYENRQLKKEQFRDNTVDAGEVGSGQSVTALYEVKLKQKALNRSAQQQSFLSEYKNPVAVVRVRYRRMDNSAIEEIESPVYASDISTDFKKMPARYKLGVAVAELAEILRGSPFCSHDYRDVAKILRDVARDMSLDIRVQELTRLVESAKSMSRVPYE